MNDRLCAAALLTESPELNNLQNAVDEAFRHLGALVRRGDGSVDNERLDSQQLQCYDLAWCTAELAACQSLLTYAERTQDDFGAKLTAVYVAEALQAVHARLTARAGDFGLDIQKLLDSAPTRSASIAHALSAQFLEDVGKEWIARDGRLPPSGLDPERELMRETFERFAGDLVEPRAQEVHRADLDVPEEIIRGAAALGLFGVTIPQRFGGLQTDDSPDTLTMVVVTEALSRASLGIGGSLVTRPEIMARALLAGGTEQQQRRWLPRLARGDALCAIAVTEPGHGSDVAGLRLRANRVAGGWTLSGEKTWCTFAGRAELLLVLARTSTEAALGHRGLSLFVVEKKPHAGHHFDEEMPGGGRLSGRAIPTLGYRGMHSFGLSFQDVFVGEDNLVGGEQGLGRGFYMTMRGFAGGRIQTAARACGVIESALHHALLHGMNRSVFGKPLASLGLARARFARMAAWLLAARQFSYRVAKELDAGLGDHEASLVKLFACRAAEWITRDAMQMHGGMGYAVESAVSRLFVDARVLSIFEGAEEALALKIIARERIERTRSAH